MSDKSKLLEKKQYGDNVTIAKMLGTSPPNVAQLIRRTNAKRHIEAIDALEKVIESRDKLISK
jgi:predicted transcriptional regulator